MTKKVLWILCGIIALSGCYTQFAVVRRAPPPPQVTYEIDSLGDTVKVVHTTDTVVNDRENCYWTRNMWGEHEWRCGSYYSHSWYLYNDYPWWYSSYPYYYDFYGRCPQYYYWDASCGSCRRYADHGFYNSSNRGGGNISSTSGAQSAHRSRITPASQQSTTPAASTQNPTNSTITGASKVEAPAINSQVPAGVNPGSTASIPAPEPERGTIQSSPQPPASSPPPSNNNGGSGNNEQRHRNPRSR